MQRLGTASGEESIAACAALLDSTRNQLHFQRKHMRWAILHASPLWPPMPGIAAVAR